MRSSEYVCIRAYDGLTVGGLYNVYNVYYGSRVPSHYGIVNDYNKYRLYSSSLFMCVGDYRDYKIGRYWVVECKVCGKGLSVDGNLIPWYNVDGGEELRCFICKNTFYICNVCYNKNYNKMVIHRCLGCDRDHKIGELLGGDDVSM